MISSTIIEHLLAINNETVLYFFCKHDQPGKTSLIDVLSALVIQFAKQDHAIAAFLYERSMARDPALSLGALEKLTETAFESQLNCFVIVDGLDECQDGEAEKIISYLTTIQEASKSEEHNGIRLLLVGQRTDILTQQLVSATSISLDVPEHQADVHRYVQHAAEKVKDEFGFDFEIESKIIAKVTAVATSKTYTSMHLHPLTSIQACTYTPN